MTRRSENLQTSLFEAERPCVELRAAQKSELAMVIEVLLREIAADRVVGDAWIVPAGRMRSLFGLQLGMVAALPVQDHDPSPARSHDRAGRRHLARRPALGGMPQ